MESFDYCPAAVNRVNIDLLYDRLIKGVIRMENRRMDPADPMRLFSEPEQDTVAMSDTQGAEFNEETFLFAHENGKIDLVETEDWSESSSVTLDFDSDLDDLCSWTSDTDHIRLDGEDGQEGGGEQDLSANSLCAEALPTFSEEEISARIAAIQSAYLGFFSQLYVSERAASEKGNDLENSKWKFHSLMRYLRATMPKENRFL
jgi:hypothetical protein